MADDAAIGNGRFCLQLGLLEFFLAVVFVTYPCFLRDFPISAGDILDAVVVGVIFRGDMNLIVWFPLGCEIFDEDWMVLFIIIIQAVRTVIDHGFHSLDQSPAIIRIGVGGSGTRPDVIHLLNQGFSFDLVSVGNAVFLLFVTI